MNDVDFILSARPDLTASQCDYLRTQPLAKVKEFVRLLPAPAGGTKGAVRSAQLPVEQSREVAQRFGRNTQERRVHFEGRTLVLPQISRQEAARVIAKRSSEGPLPRGAELSASDVMRMAMMTKGRAHE